jgi:hypothetical protein
VSSTLLPRDAFKPLNERSTLSMRVFWKWHGSIGCWLGSNWLQCRLIPKPYISDRASNESVISKAAGCVPRSYIGSLLSLSVFCFRHSHQDVFILDWDPGCQHLHGIFKVRIQ